MKIGNCGAKTLEADSGFARTIMMTEIMNIPERRRVFSIDQFGRTPLWGIRDEVSGLDYVGFVESFADCYLPYCF